MKRIVKDPDVRRTEIVRAAEKLFEKIGYEKTSVEAIIKDVGIAKGTFYYYFKAKQDVLRALVEHISSEMAEHFNAIAENSSLSAIEKLQQMLKGPKNRVKKISSVMKIIHHPENRALQEQLNIQGIKIIAPLIAKVLNQGNKEGVFNSAVSVETIQLILAGSQFILDSGLFEWSSKKRSAFLKSIQALLEQITGAERGTFGFIAKQR